MKKYIFIILFFIFTIILSSCHSGGLVDEVREFERLYNNIDDAFAEYQNVLEKDGPFETYDYINFSELDAVRQEYYTQQYGRNIEYFAYLQNYVGLATPVVIEYTNATDAEAAYNSLMITNDEYFVYENMLLIDVYPSYLLIDSEIVMDGNNALNKTKDVLLYNKVDEIVEVPKGVLKIAGEAFYKNLNIRELHCSNELEVIGRFAFYKCPYLTKIVFNKSLKEINYGAFLSCAGLRSLTFPDSLEVIGDSSFYSCQALYLVKINDGCKRIEGEAFYYCGTLQEVVIPSTVEYVGSKAFSFTKLYLEFCEIPSEWDLEESSTIYLNDRWEYDQNGKPKIK